MQNSVLGKSGKFDGPSGEEKEKDTVQSGKQQLEQIHGQLTAPAPTIISSKQIKLGRQIGQGAFGAVHDATCFNAHGSVRQLFGGRSALSLSHTHTHTRAQTHSKTPARTHTRTHAHARTHTHTHTHAHTHTFHLHACEIPFVLMFDILHGCK